MTNHGRIADFLKGQESGILASLPEFIASIDTTELLDFLALLESPKIFKGRLPLRLQIYAWLSENAPTPSLRLLALVRLLRRLGARKDVPDMGSVPQETADFAEYLGIKAHEFSDDQFVVEAVESLAIGTRAFRSGDILSMRESGERGLKALENISEWINPSAPSTIESLLICETGHELIFIAANGAFRSGDVSRARDIVEMWAGMIEEWEQTLGMLPRQRYQYYQLVGHLDFEIGLHEDALKAYNKALEYAPTPYRKAFLWLSQAQIERSLGRYDDCWQHATDAIRAILDSPYPQAALTWIEWLALEINNESQVILINDFRKQASRSGEMEINRVTRAMTEMYRLLGDLHTSSDPSSLLPTLDKLIDEFASAESSPNLVTILATKAVIAGRLNDREMMESAIDQARNIISSRIAPEARPPAEFFLENAHAIALRDVGDYDEAFRTLFEGALEARMKYPGVMGVEERTTLEALYYLGALAGHDPETIEKRIRDTINIG